jgi:hypothetical protein
MKTIVFYLMFAMLAVGQVFAEGVRTDEWGVVTNGIQISIRLKGDDKEIKVNQSFNMLIQIRNVSTNELFHCYYSNRNGYDLSFTVIDPSGKDVSPIVRNDDIGGSGAAIFVPPNQIKRFQFNLSYLHKFDEIGTYKFIAKQKGYVGKSQNEFTVISNPLYVTVVPDK